MRTAKEVESGWNLQDSDRVTFVAWTEETLLEGRMLEPGCCHDCCWGKSKALPGVDNLVFDWIFEDTSAEGKFWPGHKI